MISINIDSAKLLAMSLLAAKQDVRQYLNGVNVEATATQTRLAASNGHYLGMHAKANPLETNEGCEWETLTIPLDVIAKLGKPGKYGVAICTVLIEEPNPLGDINDQKRTYTLRTWEGVMIPFKPLDGKYPDMRRVVPSGAANGQAVPFDAEYLALFVKVNKAFGASKPGFLSLGHHGGDQRGTITIKLSDPDFVGVLMGMRNDNAFAQRVKQWGATGPDIVEVDPGHATDEEEREFIEELQPGERHHAGEAPGYFGDAGGPL